MCSHIIVNEWKQLQMTKSALLQEDIECWEENIVEQIKQLDVDTMPPEFETIPFLRDAWVNIYMNIEPKENP